MFLHYERSNKMRFTEKDFEKFEVPAEELARWLIGKILCHEVGEGNDKFTIKCRIKGTEAYRKIDDETDANRQSQPTAQLLSGGHIYFYNKKGEGRQRLDIVANHEGIAESVLICAVDPYNDGPQITVWALNADENSDGVYLLDTKSPYWLEDDGAIVSVNDPIPRKNIKDKTPLRFFCESIEYKK